jgi:thiol-disulfide isomerase/thioredoxin
MVYIKTLTILILMIFTISGCTMAPTQMEEKAMDQRMTEEEMEEKAMDQRMTEEEMEEKAMETQRMIEEGMDESAVDWRDVELNDVATGNKFKISDFKGKTILLESFAVWCPICRKQQDKLTDLHAGLDNEVVSISLDTDPNEDEQKVIEHINRYGYDWLFAVAPVEMTHALIDEFGITIVNAPGAPVVLICEDLSARLLGRGVKSADDLKEEIDKGC